MSASIACRVLPAAGMRPANGTKMNPSSSTGCSGSVVACEGAIIEEVLTGAVPNSVAGAASQIDTSSTSPAPTVREAMRWLPSVSENIRDLAARASWRVTRIVDVDELDRSRTLGSPCTIDLGAARPDRRQKRGTGREQRRARGRDHQESDKSRRSVIGGPRRPALLQAPALIAGPARRYRQDLFGVPVTHMAASPAQYFH